MAHVPTEAPGRFTGQHIATTGGLMLLAVVMVLVRSTSSSRSVQVAVLLAAMLAQVTLIAANSMQLRRAHPGIIWTFVGGLLATGLLLYVVIVPDAIRIREMLVGAP